MIKIAIYNQILINAQPTLKQQKGKVLIKTFNFLLTARIIQKQLHKIFKKENQLWTLFVFIMARTMLNNIYDKNKMWLNKFHVHQSQAQIEIWHSPYIPLTFTWTSPDYHLTFPFPLQDP